jgi:hypothetical protein
MKAKSRLKNENCIALFERVDQLPYEKGRRKNYLYSGLQMTNKRPKHPLLRSGYPFQENLQELKCTQ